MEQKIQKKHVNNKTTVNEVSKSNTFKKKKKNSTKTNILYYILGVVTGIVLGTMFTIVYYENHSDSNRINASNVQNEEQNEMVNSVDKMLEKEGFVIKTPVVDLYYPSKWKNQVRVELINEDFYVVRFFATLEGKEALQIFDITFGGDEGYNLGYYKGKDDVKIPINIVSYDFEIDEEWTNEEENMIYAMLEDVNYIIGKLQKEVAFEFAE